MSDSHLRLFELVRDRMHAVPAEAKATRLGPLGKVGAVTLAILHEMGLHSAFIGQISLEIVAIFRRPMLFRPKETVAQFQSVTVDAIPIVALVTFLIGVVFAYLLGVQAQHLRCDDLRGRRRRHRDLPRALADPRRRDRRRPIGRCLHGADRLDEGPGGDRRDHARSASRRSRCWSSRGSSPSSSGLPLLVFVGDLAGIAGGIADQPRC